MKPAIHSYGGKKLTFSLCGRRRNRHTCISYCISVYGSKILRSALLIDQDKMALLRGAAVLALYCVAHVQSTSSSSKLQVHVSSSVLSRRILHRSQCVLNAWIFGWVHDRSWLRYSVLPMKLAHEYFSHSFPFVYDRSPKVFRRLVAMTTERLCSAFLRTELLSIKMFTTPIQICAIPT
jgi:hypothetical protein